VTRRSPFREMHGPIRAAAIALGAAALLLPAGAGAWTLDLADSVQVAGTTVRIADVVREPVPAEPGAVVVASGGRPGASFAVTGRAILRRLSVAGLAGGVVLAGAERCRIAFVGSAIAPAAIEERLRPLLAPHVPPPAPEAPPSWLELTVPDLHLHAGGDWEVDWPEPRALAPGRNLLAVEVRDGPRRQRLAVVAVLHAFARTAAPVTAVARGQDPPAESLQWQWTDLALAEAGLVTDPAALGGMIAARDLAPGESLNERDLAPRPLVRRGETVSLVARRGNVVARVRVECRQDGRLGQAVSVRNPLDGRLLVAHVAAEGVVSLER